MQRTGGLPSSVTSVSVSSPLELPGVFAIDAGVPPPMDDGLRLAPAAGLALADVPRGFGAWAKKRGRGWGKRAAEKAVNEEWQGR